MSAFWQDTGSGLTGALAGAGGAAAIPMLANPWGIGLAAGLAGYSALRGTQRAREKTRSAERTAKDRIKEKRRKKLMEKYQARKQEQNLASGGMRRRMSSRNSMNQDGNILSQDFTTHASGSF